MTLAICWKCGSQKIGAFTACPGCGEIPSAPADKATSLLLTDHFRGGDQLAILGQSIAKGEPPKFDEAELEQAESIVRDLPDKPPWGCVVLIWSPIVLAILLAIVLVRLYLVGAFR